MNGYVIVKYLDITGPGDDIVIETERLELSLGKHIVPPKEFESYRNIPYDEPVELNPSPCDDIWMPKEKEPIPFGNQRVVLSQEKKFMLVEFYYKRIERL